MDESTESINYSESAVTVCVSAGTKFEQEFGAAPEYFAVSPGRVNVIGEHIDYNGGFVLPAAIERYMVVATRPNDSGIIRLASANQQGRVEFSVDRVHDVSVDGWARYALGVLAGLRQRGFDLVGFDGMIESTIPSGAGLSSSAALETAVGVAALEAMQAEMSGLELARLCQEAEHRYAGVPCGLMDQAAVANCVRDNLLLLDCQTETFEQVPFNLPDWRLLVLNTGVKHDLADGQYKKRRMLCEEACRLFEVESLRALSPAAFHKKCKAMSVPKEVFRAARHVVSEIERVEQFGKALRDGDVVKAGLLLNKSHLSLKNDYRVSCKELDFVAEKAQEMLGVAGCRMTGGGFGGSCIALAQGDLVDDVIGLLSDMYRAEFYRELESFVTRPEHGAGIVRNTF